MRNKPIFIALLILGVIALIAGGILLFQKSEEDPYGLEASKEIAKSWILNNAPTYKFDGFNLDFEEVNLLRYEFVFTFESRHAGYGDRTGRVLAAVITPHTISVIIEKGKVTRVVTDKKYDEMKGQMR